MIKKIALFLCQVCMLEMFSFAQAQVSHCGGFTAIRESIQPIYPPIAKAAHVSGMVIFLVTFSKEGDVEALSTISGPPMLIDSATTAVKLMKVNPYSGPRTCPFVVDFKLGLAGDDIPKPPDIQHMSVTALALILSDPAVYRRRKFLGFF